MRQGQVERLFIGGPKHGEVMSMRTDTDHWVVAVPGPPTIIDGVYGTTERRTTYRRETFVFDRLFMVPVMVADGVDLRVASRLALPLLLSPVALKTGSDV